MRMPIMLNILFAVATLSVTQAAESATDPLSDEKKLVKERLTEKPDTVILAVDGKRAMRKEMSRDGETGDESPDSDGEEQKKRY